MRANTPSSGWTQSSTGSWSGVPCGEEALRPGAGVPRGGHGKNALNTPFLSFIFIRLIMDLVSVFVVEFCFCCGDRDRWKIDCIIACKFP